MVYGRRTIDGYSRYFDPYTGACDKIGYQNPSQYFQVSSRNVTLPAAAYSTPYSYVTPSRIDVDASRQDCVNAMVSRAYEYLGAPYVWNYSLSPSQGVDCSGLVMQCLFACGMDLDDYNPYMHWYDPWHAHDANNMAADARFKHVSLFSIPVMLPSMSATTRSSKPTRPRRVSAWRVPIPVASSSPRSRAR